MGSGGEVNHSKYVFCVDGSPTFQHVLNAVFERRNFTTTVQGYSPDIFDRISSAHPDVIVVDLAFGQDTGWNLLDRLANGATGRRPVIVTSTDRRIIDKARLKQVDSKRSHAYLVKPYDMTVLFHTAIQLIDEERDPYLYDR